MQKTLLVAGCGHDGRLGLGSEANHTSFIRHPFFKKHGLTIVSIHVGGYHTFVRTTTGVYAFGLNEDGQLGLGEKTPSFHTPQLVPFFGDGSALVDISCGAYHTVAWMVDGVYSCGSNTFGQLGQQDYDSRSHFTRIPTINAANPSSEEEGEGGEGRVREASSALPLLPVTHISCGTYHTLIGLRDIVIPRQVKSGGGEEEEVPHLYPIAIVACGKGDFGELGYDAEHWDVMAAKERRIKDAVNARAHHVSMGGNAASFNALLGGGISQSEAAPSGAGVYADESSASPEPNPIVETTTGMTGPKFKPKPKFNIKTKPRRPEFSHPTLKPISMKLLDDQAVPIAGPGQQEASAAVTKQSPQRRCCVKRIVQLKAAHLHSIVQLEIEQDDDAAAAAASTFPVTGGNEKEIVTYLGDAGRVSRVESYHFGCYYCNGVEGNESSIPARDEDYRVAKNGLSAAVGGIVFHAGSEICFGVAGLNNEKLPLGAAAAPVLVKGKGNIGLGDDDSFEQQWRELSLSNPLLSSNGKTAEDQEPLPVEIRKVCGREHFLLWTRVRSLDPNVPFVDSVHSFGDNLMGQVGCGSDDDKKLAPVRILSTKLPPVHSEALDGKDVDEKISMQGSVPGVDVARVLDVACGFRHSLLLVEERV